MINWRLLAAGLFLLAFVLLVMGQTYLFAIPLLAGMPIAIFINKLEGDDE